MTRPLGEPLGAPIGPRRHLILYRRHHFQAAADFINALGLGIGDVRLVTPKDLHSTKSQWIEEVGLPRAGYPSGAEGRKVASTQELLVLWVVTHSSLGGSSDARSED